MKIRQLLPVLVLFLCFKSGAVEITNMITPYTGVSAGQINERIYSSYGYECSLLEWQEMPFSIWGLNNSFEAGNVRIEFDGNVALPVRCGNMLDSDWDGDGIKHTYSINECTGKLNIDLNVFAGYKIEFLKKFWVEPNAGIEYDFNQFKSRNGYGWYGAGWATGLSEDVWWYDSRARKAKLYGVDFYRHSLFSFLGINAGFSPAAKTKFCISFEVSPYCYLYNLDHHLNKTDGLYYLSEQQGLFKVFKGNLSFSYDFTDKISLFTRIDYFVELLKKGEFYAKIYEGQDLSLTDQASGSDSWKVDFCAGCSFKL